MPSVIAHPFVALGLAPYLRRSGLSVGVVVLGAVCTVVPDLDVIGFRLGIPYDAVLGHRGFSHSLLFAVVLASTLTLVLRSASSGASPQALFWFLFACTASHGVLDALTNGGLGVAFFSPFSNERYFLPWRPIAVSPLSLARFLSGQGVSVLLSELCWVMLPALALGGVGWWWSKRAGRT